MSDQYHIQIVSVWMGPLPSYLPLFLRSCRASTSVSFLIVSDQRAPDGLPDNVDWSQMSLPEFNALASERLETPVEVTTGFKLNDLKPMYGVLFPEQVADADYWGCCDLDLCWGDLARLSRSAMRDGADVITFRGPGWTSGPLSLFKRDSAATRLFEEAPGWKAICMDPSYIGFDEVCGRWENRHCETIKELVDRGLPVSLTNLVTNAEREGRLRWHRGDALMEPAVGGSLSAEWTSGMLVETTPGREGERIGLHYVHLKHNPAFVINVWDPMPDRFWITPTGTTTIPPSDSVRRWAQNAYRHVQALPHRARRLARRVAGRLRRTVGHRP